MHDYYKQNAPKFKKAMNGLLKPVSKELERYLCNLDYVMFGVFGVPLYREHTCFEDGDYCDFKLKMDAKPMKYWPPVFVQGKGYK